MPTTIEIKNLKKHFGKVKAVDGIDISVERGEIFGFLGPNGAGKTTAIRCMMDFIRPTAGEIKILDKDAQADSEVLKSDISYLPGNVRLYDSWTGLDHVNFCESFGGKKSAARELAKQLDLDLKIKFHHLSSGNKQKLGIVLALMKEPKLLILDEPTLALDPLLQNITHHLLLESGEKGTTVFISSHNLSEVERICDRVGIIKAGKMVAVENIKNLKEKRMHTVTATFVDNFKLADFKVPGVDKIEEIDGTLIIKTKGEINPLLSELAKYQLKDLEISHATLEEIFLEFYGRR